MSGILEIEILDGNVNDDSLKLSKDDTEAWCYNKDFVVWVIPKGTNVDSIVSIVAKDPKVKDIFIQAPYQNGDQWNAQIKDNMPDDYEFEYIINWKDQSGKEHPCDPKITVNPVLVFK